MWSPDGPMRRRCYAGAELVAEPLGVAVPRRRRGHAARDDRDARRPTTSHGGLREPRRRQRRARLRRWRLRRAERPRAPRRAALRRGRGARHRGSRPHAAAAHARTPRGAPTRRPSPRAAAACRRRVPRGDERAARSIRVSCARPRELLPAGARGRGATPAKSSARICSTRWRSAWATTSRRPARSAPSASRSPAGATACSPCSSRGAALSVDARLDGEARRRRRRRSSRALLHAEPVLVGGDARCRRGARAAELGVAVRGASPIDEAVARELEADARDAAAAAKPSRR